MKESLKHYWEELGRGRVRPPRGFMERFGVVVAFNGVIAMTCFGRLAEAERMFGHEQLERILDTVQEHGRPPAVASNLKVSCNLMTLMYSKTLPTSTTIEIRLF